MSQQPTFQITKEHFVGVINSLREQYVKDKNSSEAFGQIFNAEAGLYDNSLLINSIFSFLHEVFPKDEEGNCEIEHYCYVLSFGRNGDDYESPEELYTRLCFQKAEKFNAKNFSDFSKKMDLELWDKNIPIAPEDAFLPTQEMRDSANAIVIQYPAANEDDSCFATLSTELKGIYMSDKAFEDKFPSSHWIRRPFPCKNPDKTDAGKPSAQLIDEIGMFPFYSKKGIVITESDNAGSYISSNAYRNIYGKPSPDEAGQFHEHAYFSFTQRNIKKDTVDLTNRVNEIYNSEKAKSERAQYVKPSPDETA